jgi:hypothetical protein
MVPFVKEGWNKCKVALTPANVFIFINKSNHWFLAIILIVCTPLENAFLKTIDGTSAPIDAGVYSTVYTAMIAAAVLLGFATMGQRINHRPMFNRVDDDESVKKALETVSPFKQLCLSFLSFWLYVFFAGFVFYSVCLVSAAG